MKTKLSIILLASLLSLNVFSAPIRDSSWSAYLYGAAEDSLNNLRGGANQVYANVSNKVSDRGNQVITMTNSKLEETKKLTSEKLDEKLDQTIDEVWAGTIKCISGVCGKLTDRLVGEQPNAKDEKAKNPKTVKNTSEANDQTLTNKINEDAGYDSSILGIALLSTLSGIIYYALKYYKKRGF